MHLIVKTEFNEYHINLLIINKIMIILLNKYNQFCFYNIIICFCYTEDIQYNFLYVHFSYTVYMPFQYSLFFLYNDSD